MYLVFFQLVKRPDFFLLEEAAAKTARAPRPGLTPDLRRSIAARLSAVLDEDEAFLKEDLSLPELAATLEISTHDLSNVINQEFQTNFYRLINGRRIDHARLLLADGDLRDETILNIAFRSGFNSRASFNRAFKEITGQTPRSFRQKNTSQSIQ